jgi:hypothetical protein
MPLGTADARKPGVPIASIGCGAIDLGEWHSAALQDGRPDQTLRFSQDTWETLGPLIEHLSQDRDGVHLGSVINAARSRDG